MYSQNVRQIEVKDICIRIKQDTAKGLAGVVWDCALVYIAWMNKNFEKIQKKFEIEGKKVLELGSGTGVCGFSFALFKPDLLILTDMASNLELIDANKQDNQEVLNSKDVKVDTIKVEQLEWGEDSKDFLNIFEKYGSIDIIIGSDLIYSDPDKKLLLQTLERFALKNEKVKIIIGYTYHKPSDRVFFELAKTKWNIQFIHSSEMDEDFQAEDIGIVIMTYKTNDQGNSV